MEAGGREASAQVEFCFSIKSSWRAEREGVPECLLCMGLSDDLKRFA